MTVLFVVVRVGGLLEDSLDFGRRCLGDQRDDHGAEEAGDETGQELIDTGGGGQQVVPEDVDDRAADDTGDRAGIIEPFPEDRQKDDGTERGAEEAPGVFDEVHNGLCALSSGACQEVGDDGDHGDDTAGDPDEFLVRGLFPDEGLVDIVGERRRCDQQLRVRSGHGGRNDGCQQDAGQEGREVTPGQMDEDRGLKAVGQKLAGDGHTAEIGDDEGGRQGNGDPDDGDGGGLLDHGRLLDGHEADQDVGHAEVAETPGETGDDVLPGGGEEVCDEGIFGAVGDVGVNGVDRCGVQVLHEDADDGDRQQGEEHEVALDEVGPADRLEAAEEGVEQDDGGKDEHGRLTLQARDQGDKDRGTGDETGGDVNGKADEEHDGCDNGQDRFLREETVLQIFGQRDRVVGNFRELSEPFRNEDPVERGADGKTDADPGFAEAEGQDGAGETHQKPCGHVGGLGTQRGDPGAHLTAAEEVLLFTVAVFSGADKEKDAHTDDQYEIEHKGQHFIIHISYSFSYPKIGIRMLTLI